nr:PREDICTED: brain and acute leukemia cytoplasmic protein-like isoform X1 [Lepisosteus oculatus]XP_015207809.1 PREDICTED: brain and acute leukemia cytoplasmic protein-like isoform X1 [Lepisosteus oculatus]
MNIDHCSEKQHWKTVMLPEVTMGCGGSRTDALEPKYMESWTKETESTWLTSTDTDVPLSSIENIPSEHSSESGFINEEKIINTIIFGDGIPSSAQAYLKVCSTMSDPSLNDGKPSSDSAVSSNKQQGALPSSDTTVQKRSVLRTEETKWQANRMSTKQVTITVTQSIRQIDKTGKITEKTHTTFEVMKPGDPLKEGTGSNVLK